MNSKAPQFCILNAFERANPRLLDCWEARPCIRRTIIVIAQVLQTSSLFKGDIGSVAAGC